MSKLEKVVMIFDDKVRIIDGKDAELYQKHMQNLMAWASKQELNPFDKEVITIKEYEPKK